MRTATQIPVSVIISSKCEELSIARCVQAVSEFSQIVVVDSASPDRTQELAKEAGAEVVNYVWNGRYPKKKQWCLENIELRNEYVLFIDADEKPSRKLIEEISTLAKSREIERFAAYDISLDYHFLGKSLKHGHKVVKRALVNARRTTFPPLDDLEAPGMAEQEGHYQPIANGAIGSLNGKIVHDDQDPFSTWLSRHNRYSDWEAYLSRRPALASQIAELRSGRGRRYRHVPLRPITFFIYSYLLKQGFRDGWPGFHYALAHSFYFWQIQVKNYEARVRERNNRLSHAS
jgi:glycosyltransferase involved in cell wall biosynthesis